MERPQGLQRFYILYNIVPVCGSELEEKLGSELAMRLGLTGIRFEERVLFKQGHRGLQGGVSWR